MDRETLKLQLKNQIIQYLNLLNTKPEDIGDDDAFFGEKLALDSIDSLELIVLPTMVRGKTAWQIRIKANSFSL